MAFLDKIRLSNVLRKNTATEDPFGMPEIDLGNLGALLRQVGPIADTMNRDNDRRKQEMNEFDRSVSRRPMMQTRMPTIGPNAPKKNVIYKGTEPLTPTQQFMRRDDERRQVNQDKNEQLNTNFMRQQDLIRQDRNDKEFSMDKDVRARKELSTLDLNKAIQLEGVRSRTASDMAKFNANARREDIIAREKTRGEETRRTNDQKPVVPKTSASNPLNDTRDFTNKVQQLAIDHPSAAKFITKDEGTGQFRISEDASPEQTAWLQKYLGGNKPAESKPTGTGVMRQRNKSTGQMRESTDGGKTWKVLK